MARIEAQLAQRLAKEGLQYRLVSRIKSPWSIYSKMRSEHKSLRPGDGRVRFPHRGRARSPSATTRWAWCMRCTSRSTAASATSSRSRRPTATSRCTRCCSGRTARRSRCRSAPRRWTLIAERGIAAHWAYKTDGGAGEQRAEPRARMDRRPGRQRRRRRRSSLEFLENVKVDLFPDEVYLFTPQGRHPRRCRAMRPRSTSPTRAYRRRQPRGRRARRQEAGAAAHRLASGQSVEVITAPSAAPKPQWLELVVTGKARTAIRHQLKQLQHEDAVDFGHRMLDRALEALGSSLDGDSARACWMRYLAEHRYSSGWKSCWPTSRSATACPTQVAQRAGSSAQPARAAQASARTATRRS